VNFEFKKSERMTRLMRNNNSWGRWVYRFT